MSEAFIGLVGGVGSGKSSCIPAVESVVGSVSVVRISDLIKAELLGLGEEISRQSLHAHGDRRRCEEYGYWMLRALDRCREHSRTVAVVDGIRNLGEIEVLRKKAGGRALVIGFPASIKTREMRLLARERDIDVSEDVRVSEVIHDEMQDVGPFGLELEKCISEADHQVDAELPLAAANAEVERIVRFFWNQHAHQ